MADPEIDAMNRMSAALSELGESAIQMVRVEREACAKLVEERANASRPNSTVYHALMCTAELIRTRQPD